MSKRWIKIAALADVPEGGTLCVYAGGEPICLYNLRGTICATQDTCTHADASLADGYIDGDLIECPMHQATFDIRTGKAMSPPATDDLRVYEVDVDGDDIRILAD
jgi:nitrite reductase/ring-hydroxylating ferredoxin subunit